MYLIKTYPHLKPKLDDELDPSLELDVSIHVWIFMTNHVRLLATPHKENALSQMMQALGRRYVRYFNRDYRRTGT